VPCTCKAQFSLIINFQLWHESLLDDVNEAEVISPTLCRSTQETSARSFHVEPDKAQISRSCQANIRLVGMFRDQDPTIHADDRSGQEAQ
jgi:hypothetical protein